MWVEESGLIITCLFCFKPKQGQGVLEALTFNLSVVVVDGGQKDIHCVLAKWGPWDSDIHSLIKEPFQKLMLRDKDPVDISWCFWSFPAWWGLARLKNRLLISMSSLIWLHAAKCTTIHAIQVFVFTLGFDLSVRVLLFYAKRKS